ncbi:hypothetical protein AB0758_32860 [Tolypothrix bouteillei VB521301_2]
MYIKTLPGKSWVGFSTCINILAIAYLNTQGFCVVFKASRAGILRSRF